jgi:hypothetical protein
VFINKKYKNILNKIHTGVSFLHGYIRIMIKIIIIAIANAVLKTLENILFNPVIEYTELHMLPKNELNSMAIF